MCFLSCVKDSCLTCDVAEVLASGQKNRRIESHLLGDVVAFSLDFPACLYMAIGGVGALISCCKKSNCKTSPACCIAEAIVLHDFKFESYAFLLSRGILHFLISTRHLKSLLP